MQRLNSWTPRMAFPAYLPSIVFPRDCAAGLVRVLSPASPFRAGILVCKLGPRSLTTLSGTRLIETVTPFVSKTSRVLSEAEARLALRNVFGISVDETEAAAAGGSRLRFQGAKGYFAPAIAESTYGAAKTEGKEGKGEQESEQDPATRPVLSFAVPAELRQRLSPKAYLDRIGFKASGIESKDGLPAPTLQTLADIVRYALLDSAVADLVTEPTCFCLGRLHLYTVPFENLSQHRGPSKTVVLDYGVIYDKVVTKKQGGPRCRSSPAAA